MQSKLQLVKNSQGKDGVGLAVNRKGVQVGVMPHSSKQQQQPNTIKLIPAAKVITLILSYLKFFIISLYLVYSLMFPE